MKWIGFVCDTEEEYYHIIEKIKNAEIDNLKVRNNAREKILTNHNMNNIAKEYFEIYCKGDDCY